VNGNHDEIRKWRRRCALRKTLRNRPDLLRAAQLSDEDRQLVVELERDKE
jgi:tRNA (guanine37-N1)-methyltransferase